MFRPRLQSACLVSFFLLRRDLPILGHTLDRQQCPSISSRNIALLVAFLGSVSLSLLEPPFLATAPRSSSRLSRHPPSLAGSSDFCSVNPSSSCATICDVSKLHLIPHRRSIIRLPLQLPHKHTQRPHAKQNFSPSLAAPMVRSHTLCIKLPIIFHSPHRIFSARGKVQHSRSPSFRFFSESFGSSQRPGPATACLAS